MSFISMSHVCEGSLVSQWCVSVCVCLCMCVSMCVSVLSGKQAGVDVRWHGNGCWYSSVECLRRVSITRWIRRHHSTTWPRSASSGILSLDVFINLHTSSHPHQLLMLMLYITEEHIALHGKSISELWDVTCHIGSHTVTCYPTQVNALRLNPASKLEGWKAELT